MFYCFKSVLIVWYTARVNLLSQRTMYFEMYVASLLRLAQRTGLLHVLVEHDAL